MGDRFGWCQTLENVDDVLNMTYDYAIENNPNLNWIDEYRYNSSVTQVINKRFPGSMAVKKTKGGIKNSQSREAGNIGYTRRRQKNTICVGHYYAQRNTNDVNELAKTKIIKNYRVNIPMHCLMLTIISLLCHLMALRII